MRPGTIEEKFIFRSHKGYVADEKWSHMPTKLSIILWRIKWWFLSTFSNFGARVSEPMSVASIASSLKRSSMTYCSIAPIPEPYSSAQLLMISTTQF